MSDLTPLLREAADALWLIPIHAGLAQRLTNAAERTRPSEAEVTKCKVCYGLVPDTCYCWPAGNAALSTPPLPSAEPVAWLREDGAATSPFAKREWPELNAAFTRPVYTTPPAAAQDTGRLDWLEENGGRISGPADDSPRFVIWGDTDAQDVQGETLREAIDDAMDAARAAGGE